MAEKICPMMSRSICVGGVWKNSRLKCPKEKCAWWIAVPTPELGACAVREVAHELICMREEQELEDEWQEFLSWKEGSGKK